MIQHPRNIPPIPIVKKPAHTAGGPGTRNSFLSRLSCHYFKGVHLHTKEAEEEPLGYESSWAGIYPEHKE